MKTRTICLFALFVMLLGSCQNESETIIQNTSGNNNIVAGSPLADLLSRVSQRPTALDNILDNSSCFGVQLPVIVIVNGQQITVNAENDYQIVKEVINAFSNDDDIVNFIFPITIQHQNFTPLIISTSNQLDDVSDNCGEDDGFDEIDCINIVYPIAINLYNTNNQIAEVVTVTNNSQLYNFIESIDSNELIAINYPVTIINSNGQSIAISSNSQLENSIDDAIDDCEGDLSEDLTFSEVLTNGNWKVSYFFDNQEETSDYASYSFAFDVYGTIGIVNGTNNSNGTWVAYHNNEEDKIELTFSIPALQELADDWRIVEYSNNRIRLKHRSGGNGSIDYLYFDKI